MLGIALPSASPFLTMSLSTQGRASEIPLGLAAAGKTGMERRCPAAQMIFAWYLALFLSYPVCLVVESCSQESGTVLITHGHIPPLNVLPHRATIKEG